MSHENVHIVKKLKASFTAENSLTTAVTLIHRYIAHNCIGSSIKHDNTRLAIIVNDRYSNKMPLQNWPFGHGYLSRHSPIQTQNNGHYLVILPCHYRSTFVVSSFKFQANLVTKQEMLLFSNFNISIQNSTICYFICHFRLNLPILPHIPYAFVVTSQYFQFMKWSVVQLRALNI